MADHESYMRRCIELAERGAGYTAPNPLVGAVLVYKDRIIGEGFHAHYGGPHAEVNCIASVAEADLPLISQSTLYVSLEPCSHFGKTPPCTDLIIKNKIPSVVIGCTDPFEKVNGSGIAKLLAAGIKVEKDILYRECRMLNKRFFTFYEKQRPYIILKWAQSADGKIAGENGRRLKISNQYTDLLVHRRRAEEAAILAGTNTVLHDDPFLTVRSMPGKNPVRIIIDSDLKIPGTAHVYDTNAQTIIINRKKMQQSGNIEFFKAGDTEDIITATLRCLCERSLISVMVEGGAHTLQSFIAAGIWDEAMIITSGDLRIGGGIASPVLKEEMRTGSEEILSDHIDFFRQKDNEFL